MSSSWTIRHSCGPDSAVLVDSEVGFRLLGEASNGVEAVDLVGAHAAGCGAYGCADAGDGRD